MKKVILLTQILLVNLLAYSQEEANIRFVFPDTVEIVVNNYIEKGGSFDEFYLLLTSDTAGYSLTVGGIQKGRQAQGIAMDTTK